MAPDLVAKIREAIVAAVALPAVKEKLFTWGVETRTMTTPEYTTFVSTQIDVWKPLIIEAGAQEK